MQRNPLTTLLIVILALRAPALLKGIALFILYFLMGLVILVVVLMLAFRWRIYKVRKQMEQQFGEGFGQQSGPKGFGGFGSPFRAAAQGARRRGEGAKNLGNAREARVEGCGRLRRFRRGKSSSMLKIFELIGRYFMLMGKVFSRPEKAAIYRRRIIYEMESLGVNSIGLTAIISVFIGAVITLQMCINLDSPFIPRSLVGYATRETMILEFSSAVVALILAGKVGSSIASEIGTMRITEQIDALEIMGVNSASYLILPKIVAAMVFFPFLTILSILIGVLGGWLIAAATGIMIPADYVDGLLMDFRPYSITYTLIKTVFFAYIITSISAFFGYYAKGNSLEVGAASTRAVVACSVVILLFDLIPDPSAAHMIRTEHIVKSFDGRRVLDDISVEFETGKTNLIIGRSGSGKTVLLKTLVGCTNPTRAASGTMR